MEKSPETSKIIAIVERMFKYRGTNYSQVASKLKTKTGTQMTRQVLYRMVHNGTLSLALFLQIAEILDFDLRLCDHERDALELRDVEGRRIRKKYKGVVYDTDKMFSCGRVSEDEHHWRIVCLEPVSDTFVVIHDCDDEAAKAKGGKKYPYIRKINPEDVPKELGFELVE